MSTFSEEIGRYIKIPDDSDYVFSDAVFRRMAVASVRDVYEKVIEYLPENIDEITRITHSSGTQGDLYGFETPTMATTWLDIVEVRRKQTDAEQSVFRKCKKIPEKEALRAADSGSLYQAFFSVEGRNLAFSAFFHFSTVFHAC